ncbi:hypothetical protein K431DRAFT_287251 [Polychaeton citri CBS 116435]|uniref:Uncharacterized protein n=1 Tax=Polychaeton citri CBS 116435 TaxID=1314669 RepID=A0A9P4Q5W9_9PEZI|nr:hypothetical protein K431DRAFT_287251 [Polychaeton citri CBS 116435]
MVRTSVKPSNGAAYAASQPLFDALATAVQQLETQKVHLTRSRDIVQQLHINLVGTTKIDDIDQHDLYIDSAVKAWRAASESYVEIFQQLTAVTAADKSQGREAAKGHANFRAIAETARLTQRASKEYKIREEVQAEVPENLSAPSSLASDHEDVGGSSEESDKGVAINKNGKRSSALQIPAVIQQRPSKLAKSKIDTIEEKIPPSRGAGERQVVLDVTNSSEKRATKSEKARQRRAKKLAKRKEAQTIKEDDTPLVANPSTLADEGNTTQSHAVEGVQYDDVTAEVNRRLEAKKEKRRAEKDAKKEKKRKRESGASVQDATEVEKRVKKKPKASDGADVSVEADQSSAKRALDAEENSGLNEEGNSRKKRRKATA